WDTISSVTEQVWGRVKDRVGDAWDNMSSKTSSITNRIKGYVEDNWDSISDTLTSVHRPIQIAIDYFYDLYKGISKWLDKVVGKVR
ncbi:hypothetical protein BM86_06610, partial [Bacillus thuringiensis]